VVRRKARRHRRHGMKIEHPLVFYPRRMLEHVVSVSSWLMLYLKFSRIHRKVLKDPDRFNYSDLALAPIAEDAENDLDLIRVFEEAIPNTYGAPVLKPQKAEPEKVQARSR